MGWATIAIVDGKEEIPTASRVFHLNEYPGWGESFNIAAHSFRGTNDWFATGGDDVYPDPKKRAKEICEELTEHFRGTMGVCQPSADEWAYGLKRLGYPLCYAPIIGGEFARRWNGGRGAFWPEYFQWYADQELHETAGEYLLVRPDLNFEHRHVSRYGKPNPEYKTNKQHRWKYDRDLYDRRKSLGFPNHSPALP